MWNCTFGGLAWLILPFLIGLVTGWWIWAQKSKLVEASTDADQTDEAGAAPQALLAAPVVEAAAAPEIIATAPEPVATAEPEAVKLTAIGIPEARGPADDLLQIKGIGPKLNAVLNDIGVMRFDQIAAWGESEIALVDNHLGAFRGRIVRDAWVEQADLLARGLIGEFEFRFGKLDTEMK
jgi:predicted flap endonuclease-1-like 5' DNA nuclease